MRLEDQDIITRRAWKECVGIDDGCKRMTGELVSLERVMSLKLGTTTTTTATIQTTAFYIPFC